jgi:IS30 family transposase
MLSTTSFLKYMSKNSNNTYHGTIFISSIFSQQCNAIDMLMYSAHHFRSEPKSITTMLLAQILKYNISIEYATVYMLLYIKWHGERQSKNMSKAETHGSKHKTDLRNANRLRHNCTRMKKGPTHWPSAVTPRGFLV